MIYSRKSPRLSVSIPVMIHFIDSDSVDGWGRIVDISTEGVRLETRWLLKTGEHVAVSLPYGYQKDSENLKAKVVHVRWDEGYYVAGLLFDASVDRKNMKRLMTHLLELDERKI